MADTLRLKKLEPGQGKTITLSTILSTLVAGASLFTFGRPLLVSWISEAAAGDIKTTVQQQVEKTVTEQLSPVVAAMRVQLQGEITTLERDIARLEFRRDRNGEWSQQDALDLVDKRTVLAQHRQALAAFDTAKRTP